MQVKYVNPDGQEQRFAYDADEVMASKAEMIEKRYGGTWAEFNADVIKGSMRARRVLLWHLLSQTHPTLRMEDVPDFPAKRVEVSFTTVELVGMRDALLKASLPDDKREEILTAIDFEITKTMEEEGLAEAPGAQAGKAPSNADVSTTG